jgi:hypothetical protein
MRNKLQQGEINICNKKVKLQGESSNCKEMNTKMLGEKQVAK